MTDAKPYIKPQALSDAQRMAHETAYQLRAFGCTAVEVSTDDNGLPVLKYTLPFGVEAGMLRNVTVRIEVKDPAATS